MSGGVENRGRRVMGESPGGCCEEAFTLDVVGEALR